MSQHGLPIHNANSTASSSIPIAGLTEFQNHLDELLANPQVPFDATLLDNVMLQLTPQNSPALLQTYFPTIFTILNATHHDPSPLLAFATELISRINTIPVILEVANSQAIMGALQAPLPAANLLGLAVLQKVALDRQQESLSLFHPQMLEALFRCWMLTPEVGVAERAAGVICNLLETHRLHGQNADRLQSPFPPQRHSNDSNGDSNEGHHNSSIGDMAVRIFTDRSVLSIISSACSAAPIHTADPPRTNREISLSQSRLLRLLPSLAVPIFPLLIETPFPDLYPLPAEAIEVTGRGLLQWAALGMIDQSDTLMMYNLHSFFGPLITGMQAASLPESYFNRVGEILRIAYRFDPNLYDALTTLANRMTEEEAEPFLQFVNETLRGYHP